MKTVISRYDFMDIAACFVAEDHVPGLMLIPREMESQIAWNKAARIEPLIQVKLVGDGYPNGFAQGRTMRDSESTQRLIYLRQECGEERDTKWVRTYLAGSRETEYVHELLFHKGISALEVRSTIQNCGSSPILIEMLSSFTMGGLTPFCEQAEEGRLLLHQIRSTWSAEGRLVSSPVEEYQLEPSWQKYSANTMRFGQAGSMPVREYAPLAAVEDTVAGVIWAAGLSQSCSWQMEISRKDEGLTLSGGLADRKFGHWMKKLGPGAKFTTPKAILTCVQGTVDQAFGRLAENMRAALRLPKSELELPVLFNEFCTSWGHPNETQIRRLVDHAKDFGIQYFVVDAGWYIDDDSQGDTRLGKWEVGRKRFPSGMKATADYIRKAGMIPGIWFEFEISGKDSPTFQMTGQLLRRDGIPITAGKRRFWDMRQEKVRNYLFKRVTGLLKECGFGYLKIDYNGNIGIGCEGAESLGEGLRQQIEAVQQFVRQLREAIPELVIENCASGGYRLVPSFLEITSMSSFSDAHECGEIPLIAANMHRMILPCQSQIWAVVRKEHSTRTLYSQICAGMLGRLCFSGDIDQMEDERRAVIRNGVCFYHKISPIINRGETEITRNGVFSYRRPKGWQAVFRQSTETSELLIVIHTFHECPGQLIIKIDPDRWSGDYEMADRFCAPEICVVCTGRELRVSGLRAFDGAAILMQKVSEKNG